MKVDTSRLKRGTSEVPPECQILIDKLKSCSRQELIEELSKIEAWTFGKCELYHWIDILDIFDEILEEATQYVDNQIYIACDSMFQDRKLLLLVLNFTTLLIEHSFSRHLYNSVDHLTQLLLSTDMEIILGVLNLLYMFSKRSNFISRLSCLKKNTLLNRLKHIAEPYGGKECGFGLADCCRPDKNLPNAIYHFYYEYYTKAGTLEVIDYQNISQMDPKQIALKLWKELDQHLDDDQKYHLFARARLATEFWNYDSRILFVQARLQALSILVYSDTILSYTSTLIYPGFLEELVELLELQEVNLVEIRAAALRTLTAIIHLERNSQYQRKSESRLNTIIEVTGASSYHGFLPTLVRNCITNLTGNTNKDQSQSQPDENLFPLQLATALFSFLYHLASYEAGAESLVSCGMMESLLRVINWSGTELEHITFVTRAVRVIDLITNLDMQSFQLNNGLNTFIKRLNSEVNLCRKEQSYEIKPNIDENSEDKHNLMSTSQIDEHMDTGSNYDADEDVIMTTSNVSLAKTSETLPPLAGNQNRTCLPQRAALLKSMLNFLKKAIQDSAFSDSIRHIMEGTLPESLKHIISNAEYYGPSLFLLATDVVTVYVFQEPSLLSSLQDNGLTDVVLQALLKKDVPATREVLGSLPNVFSALCLNNRGLESFVKYNPFDKLFRVLTSPVYLSAMRRRRSSDPMGDTASNIGNSMDELMRNQPSLKTPAIKAIIKLLEEIVDLGTDPKYVCWRPQSKNDISPVLSNSRQTNNNNADNGGSSDEDDEDEEEVSTSSHNQTQSTRENSGNANNASNESTSTSTNANTANQSQTVSPINTERIPIALIDYTLNTMKFLEAILSNNSTDDHCREFVTLNGLRPLLSILSLPNFPVTSCSQPITATAQAVASVCKSILNLTHEPSVLQVALEQLSNVVEQLKPLQNNFEHTSSSVLLKELANCPDINQAFSNASYTPLLHAMSAVHGYVVMLVHVCRTGQSDIRTLTLMKWGQDNNFGMKLLKKLVMLYTALVWESTLLLALCTDDIIPPGSEFGKDEMEKLGASDLKNITEVNWDEIVSNLSVMENLTTNSSQPAVNMDVDNAVAGPSTGAIPRKPKQDPVRFTASPSQLKYIKSLLGASSRLGRALAELFGLLVKLCVGSPLRQRRGQNFPPAPSFTSPASKDIARILSFILVDGLSFNKLPASPVPKLKLTFLICSIGFTSPMLFDEKRYAYHLMLQKLVEEGGLEAFFEMFRWTLTAGYTIPIHRAIEHPNLPDGTGEALDAWLMLLEKMVNIRSITESPHVITSKNSRVKQEFDTKHYLTYMHKHAFLSIQHLWGCKPLKTYGPRMTESMLSILKHIIKGEKVLQSKYNKNGPGVDLKQKLSPTSPTTARDPISAIFESAANAVAVNLSSNASSAAPAQPGPSSERSAEPDVNQENLQQLMDMGFSREHCIDALAHCYSLEQATDYLLNNPFASTVETTTNDEEQPAVPAATTTTTTTSTTSNANMDIDVGGEEDEQVIRAILMSLGDGGTSSQITNKPVGETTTAVEKPKPDAKAKQKEIMKKYLSEQPLLKKVLDDFTENLLKNCLTILDQLPETVYKICDLLITVVKRNGATWRDEMLDTLCKGIYQCVQYLIQVLVQDDERSKNYKEKSEKLISSEMAQKTAVRIHLFTLFFEGQYQEMKVPCALALKNYNIIPRLVKVLTDYQMFTTIINKVLSTPKWLAPLALLLDLYDKVAMSTRQKQDMHKVSTRNWQWYHITTAKWNPYTPQQNKQINDAYQNGDTDTRLVIGRNRYTINFNCMSQINDETSNHRPIIMTLKSVDQMYGNATEEKVADVQESKEDTINLMDVDSPAAKSYAKLLADIELEPLTSFVPDEIVSSCVQLMAHQQLDRDTLHAIMRVIVRLTKNYNLAEVFARFGGIDVLLGMKHISGYIGFTTLATLLIRHVIEEPKTLSLAMQNVISNKTLSTIPAGHRELLFMVRQLSSAVYRNPEIFKEAALKILKVDFDSMKRSQINDEKRFIMKSQPIPQAKYNMEQPTAQSAVCKLLKVLVEPEENSDPALLAKGNDNKKAETELMEKSINEKPLLNKAAVLKILAEAVRSYQTVALYITEHVYRAGVATVIKEDTSALSFILDKMFHVNDFNLDRDCSTMAQSLIAAIASSDVVQAQYTVVQEVKLALQRSLKEPETPEKHLHIEGLASLIPAMIENNVFNIDNNNQYLKINNHTQLRHNIFYIMVEKGIITDIARAVQYLELGGPNTIATINHLMKPLEMLLRLSNQPLPAIPNKYKKGTTTRRLLTGGSEEGGPANQQDNAQQSNDGLGVSQAVSEALSSNNVNATATTASNSGAPTQTQANQATTSDSTNAQDEQMLADDSEQNTDRDMSSAAIDSLVGENELGDHIAEVHLNEILDTLISEELRRDPNEYEDENHEDDDEENNEEDQDRDERRHLHRQLDNVESLIVRETLGDSSSDDSDSNPSENDEREMDEVDEHDDDEEEEEEAEERSELDVDEETQPFIEMYDHHMYGRHLSPSIPEIERDNEDILMIQYSNSSQNNSNGNNNGANDANSRNARDREATLNGDNISITVSNNAGSSSNATNEQPQNFFPFPNANFFNENSEQGGNENSNGAQGGSSNNANEPTAAQVNPNAPPNSHPLLSGGRGDDTPHRHHDHHGIGGTGAGGGRSAVRPRRYQFINLNSRNQPVILQRLLGPNNSDITQGIQNAYSGNFTTSGRSGGPFSFRDATRVVVMDNGFNIYNEDSESEMVDQSGYWFGRTLANHLNNLPSALSWWQEENKISGPDSNSDLCMVVCDEMIPDLDAARASELSKIRGKRKKKTMEEDDAKQKNQEKKPAEDGSVPSVPATGINVISVVPLESAVSQSTLSMISSFAQELTSQPTVESQPTANAENVDLEDVEIELARLVGDNNSQQAQENRANNENSENISFMDEENSENVTRNIQEITQRSNVDGDVEMTSDVEESSASANNSRSFSPNYSPNHQQNSDLNMLNRDTPATATQTELQSELNIQQDSSNQERPENQVETGSNQQDHPMQGDTDPDSDSDDEQNFPSGDVRNRDRDRDMDELNEALQAPLPSDDTDEEDDEEDEEEDDEDDDEILEGAVGGIENVSNEQTVETTERSSEQQAESQAENATGVTENQEGASASEQGATGVAVQEIDPSIRAILGDLEVPEGIDPSFLAALPVEMREEVINEHLRQQRLRQRAQQTAALQEAQAVTEVSPEFLAALPPNIQEEVLAHQRLEQQRQAAATANPNEPVNAAEFFQNLQPSLRQAILTDMEDSQISALPPELAAEAQNLRRDWESRNRQMLQERLLTSSFSSVFRHNNRNPRVYMPRHNFLQLNPSGSIALTRNQQSHATATANMERQGAPLLDQESLASILVLLFIDDPNLVTLRLYRVIRNLCFHVPTRRWIIRSLLSIIMRCNEESMDQYLEPVSPSASTSSSSRKNYRDQSEEKVKWLKLRLDSALGGRANVFLKKLGKSIGTNEVPLTIHPKASPTVCSHVLELLTFLAKTFPVHFLPARKPTTTPPTEDEPMPSTSQAAMNKDKNCDFWDILLRLDNEIDERVKNPRINSNLKAVCKQIKEFSESEFKTFNESPFGQLILMLSYDIIRKNSLLTDKLLRLLSLISASVIVCYKKPGPGYRIGAALLERGVPRPIGIPLTSRSIVGSQQPQPQQQQSTEENRSNNTEEATAAATTTTATTAAAETDGTNTETPNVPEVTQEEEDLVSKLPESEQHLSLAVQVLTSKSCSEDGLEDATALLINLSQCSSKTKYMIINLLVKGVVELSHQVEKHIQNLMFELKEMNDSMKQDKTKTEPSTSNDDSDDLSRPSTSKGQMLDRFTKDNVIITAPAKVKTTSCDLQLPSMAPLLSKTSNQSFFLRILKVITQIRDTARQDQKSCDAEIEEQLRKLETVPLCELLNLDVLWNTLSDCLKELEETQDHHAVLVLQPAVEAFFIVHSTPQVKNASGSSGSSNNNRSNSRSADNNISSTLRDNSINNSSQIEAAAGTESSSNNATQSADSENAVNNNSTPVVRTQPENTTEGNADTQPIPPPTASSTPAPESSVDLQNQELSDVADLSRIERPERPLSPMDTTQSNESSPGGSGQQQNVQPTQPLSSNQKKFLQFAEKHRVVLNQILRQSSTHLADGPFAVLVDHTRVLDFDVKRRYFRTELERMDEGVRREELAVHVHRVNVFEDSFRELYRRNPEEWKNRFYIVFEDEEGQDAGGLLREWYMIISREIFNPMYALFCVSPGDRVTYMINTSSHCNPNHLCYFKFVGRVIAKAIYDNKLLECYFTRSFYKHILGIPVKYTDMESEDYAFYQGLVYLMEHHVDTLGYDLTFSLEIQEFGVTEVRELIPNGGNIAVTEDNKLEYIQLVCQLKMSGSIKQQLNAFLEGFYDIIPKRLISIFNEQELELLISGLPNIDIEDLRANTEYHKYQANSIQIQWFWRALRSFDQAERAKFLQFVTGTSKVPLQGFGSLEGMNGIQKFQIHRDDRSTDRLPSAHTCFNQLDLPVYKSYEKLRTSLLKAIHECSEGFGFA